MTAFSANEILGLQPALDPRKVAKPHVVSGRNFFMDLEGPRSGFAYDSGLPEFPLWHKFFVQTFKLTDEIMFYVGQDVVNASYGIYTYDWESRRCIPVFQGILNSAYLGFPWTVALVGTYYYFANRAVGVWQYDYVANSWLDVTADFPTNTFFVTESAGRCIAMAEGVVAWSAIDDGRDFAPSAVTGAGFQALSLVGTLTRAQDYLGLKKVADGFLCFTARGVLKSTIIDSFAPFRHDPVSSSHVPMNAWAFAEIADKVHVILTHNGLYITQDGSFEVWQPIFSEYLKQKVLPGVQQAVSGLVQLHYDFTFQLLFISFSPSTTQVYFTQAFCLYVPRGEWGSFDITHTAFVQVDQVLDTKQLSFGFVLQDGTIAVFTNSTVNLHNDGGAGTYLHVKRFEIPVFKQNAPLIFSDICAELTSNPILNNVGQTGYAISLPQELVSAVFPRYYPAFSWLSVQEWSVRASYAAEPALFSDFCVHSANQFLNPANATIALRVQEEDWLPDDILQSSLAANIELGLFRFSDGEAVDQMSLVTELFLGVDSAAGVVSIEDYMAVAGNIIDDYLNDYPTDVFEDYGAGLGTSAEFVESVIGTKDGKTAFEGQEVQFTDLEITAGTRRKVGECSGIWHKVKIVADQLGDNFHLKLVEFNHFLIGRW